MTYEEHKGICSYTVWEIPMILGRKEGNIIGAFKMEKTLKTMKYNH